MTLHDLPVGQSAVVTQLHAQQSLRQRLIDLGFIEGSEIACLFSSPLGDPRAYRVHGSVIALRGRDAQSVEVISQ